MTEEMVKEKEKENVVVKLTEKELEYIQQLNAEVNEADRKAGYFTRAAFIETQKAEKTITQFQSQMKYLDKKYDLAGKGIIDITTGNIAVKEENGDAQNIQPG